MIRKFLYTGLFLLCCLLAATAPGQTVSVKASLSRDHILIGEPLELTLEATVPTGTTATWFPLDTLEHFDWVDKGKIDTAASGESTIFRQVITLTSFDSGKWVLPALPLEMGNRQYLTDSFTVSVALANMDPKADYHDIRDIEEVESPQTGFINWALGALALISVVGLFYTLRKKSAMPSRWQPVQRSDLSPLQEALQALGSLQAENPDSKEYFTRLNDTLRSYLQRRTRGSMMEKTSSEMVLAIRDRGMQPEHFSRLAQTLRMGDAVKFAKFRPGEDERKEALEIIRGSLEELDGVIK